MSSWDMSTREQCETEAERLTAEKRELDSKIERLVAALSYDAEKKVPESQAKLMRTQRDAMNLYSDTLHERIQRLREVINQWKSAHYWELL